MEVIASTPNKLVLHINNISVICGASIFANVHHKHINKLTIQPVNPQTLLLDIALLPVNNWIQNSLNFIIFVVFIMQIYDFNFVNQILFIIFACWNDVYRLM